MGQDCIWDSKEQDWEWTVQLICSSFLYGTRLPLGQRGAKQRIYIPFHYLCCSLLSQRQSPPIQKQGADQLCSPFYALLLAVPELVLSHTKVRRISSTRSPIPDAVLYSYNTLNCIFILYYMLPLYNIVMYSYTTPYCTPILYCTVVLCYNVLYSYTSLYCTPILHYSVRLYYTVLNSYNTLYFTQILHCTVPP